MAYCKYSPFPGQFIFLRDAGRIATRALLLREFQQNKDVLPIGMEDELIYISI